MAGGGTAGHLQPALAIAEALVAAGHPRAPSSSSDPSAARTGPPWTAGLPVHPPARARHRPQLSARALVDNIGAVAGLGVAAARGLGVVRRARPRVVVSVGGTPACRRRSPPWCTGSPWCWSTSMRCPGAANRLFGRFARASAVGWEGSPLPRAVVTGTPVRPEIAAVGRRPADRRAARRRLGLPADRATVAVFGGSLGAADQPAVDGLADRWADRDDRTIYHIVGRRDWDGRPAPAGPARMRRRPASGPACPLRGPDGPASTPRPTWWCAGPGP